MQDQQQTQSLICIYEVKMNLGPKTQEQAKELGLTETHLEDVQHFCIEYGTSPHAVVNFMYETRCSVEDIGGLLATREGLKTSFAVADPLVGKKLQAVIRPGVSLKGLWGYHQATSGNEPVDSEELLEELCEAHHRLRNTYLCQSIAQATQLAEVKGQQAYKLWLRGTDEISYDQDDVWDKEYCRFKNDEALEAARKERSEKGYARRKC
jgi:hypothetical protein